MRKAEIDWFYQDGASWIFPEAWDSYLEPIALDERADLLAAYYQRLTSHASSEAGIINALRTCGGSACG